jgi:ribosomal protein S18 acetylase RimI-like enzyme
MPIVYERLQNPSERDLDVIGEIYENNFPPEEKVPYEGMRAAMQANHPAFPTLVARDSDAENRVVGVIWTPRLGDSPYFFLPYFAVDQAYHGQGIGSRLLQEALSFLATLPNAETLLWEVEPPEADPNHERNRRIRFYERNGAHIVKYSEPFAMPDFTDEEGLGVVPMRIMYAPIGDSSLPNNKAQGIKWVMTILEEDYPTYKHLHERFLTGVEAMPDDEDA